MNDVAVVDDMAVAPILRPTSTARQGQQQGATEKAFQTVVVETHAQTMTDQSRRVEYPAQQEAAAASYRDQLLLTIFGALRWQGCELCPLDLQRLAPHGIGASDHLVNEAAIRIEIIKVAAAT